MTAIFLTIAAMFAAYRIGRWVSAQREADIVANYWRTLSSPPLVIQMHIGDRTAMQRRDEIVAALTEYENRWHKAGMPVCCYVYGSQIGGSSTVGISWAAFVQMSMQDYFGQLEAWNNRVSIASGDAARQYILNQAV